MQSLSLCGDALLVLRMVGGAYQRNQCQTTAQEMETSNLNGPNFASTSPLPFHFQQALRLAVRVAAESPLAPSSQPPSFQSRSCQRACLNFPPPLTHRQPHRHLTFIGDVWMGTEVSGCPPYLHISASASPGKSMTCCGRRFLKAQKREKGKKWMGEPGEPHVFEPP